MKYAKGIIAPFLAFALLAAIFPIGPVVMHEAQKNEAGRK